MKHYTTFIIPDHSNNNTYIVGMRMVTQYIL